MPRWVSRAIADKNHPVTQTLYELFHKQNPQRALRANKTRSNEKFGADSRNDVVSETLCDDAIKYLAPTLEQHKGCTIIDIHPGACIWSSKLHDFLRPKRHLLMEPEERYHDSFIKPLLDKPGSTYRHTSLAGAHPRLYWPNYQKVLSDLELAPKPALPAGDLALRQLDPSFLVIGNLSRQYRVRSRAKSVNFGSLILQQFLYAALANEIFHRGGLVRTLLWLPEADKYTMFPISEVHRRPFNARMSVGSTLTEAVGTMDLHNLGSAYYARRRRRPEVNEAFFADRAQRLMQEHGMQRPEGRDFLYERPEADLAQNVSPLETSVSTLQDLEAEIHVAEERLVEVSKQTPRKGARHRPALGDGDLLGSMKYPQCGPSSEGFSSDVRHASAAILGDMGLRIVNLEVGLRVLEEKGEDKDELGGLRDRISKLDGDLEVFALSRSEQLHISVYQMVDQQVACSMEHPLLALDARSYEPLKAEPHEFWPKNEMMLLDMVPKSRDLSVPDLADKRETAKLCEALLRSLLQSTTQTLPEALDRLAPNAAKDLLPMVPAASDPRKGGRLNPHRIRTRMLSEDIIEGLIKAWVEWPFKPSTLELELASESEGPAETEERADAPFA